MFSKLRSRLTYANVVASIALFIALGGTSYGLATGSIGSREIKTNGVRSTDIRNNDIRGKDIRNGTIGSRDVGNGALLAEDFRAGELPRGEKGDTGAPGEPATRLWAVVNADATSPAIRRQSGAVGLERRSPGVYDVRFNRSVRDCAAGAVVAENLPVGEFDRSIVAFTAGDSPGSLDNDEVLVGVFDTPTTGKDHDFSVQIFC